MTVIDPYENPHNVPDEVAAVVEEAAPEYTDLSLQRRFRIIFAIGIVGALCFGWLLIHAATSSDELDNLRGRNQQLTNTIESQQLLIDKLATQVDAARAQGAAVPAPEVVAAEVPGAEVSPVESPAPGVPGERGDAGEPGVSGIPGVVGAPGSAGSKGEPGSTGDTGETGATGSQGDPGIGVAGANGASGPAGADGAPGADGADGAPGAQGPAGPPGETGGMPVTYHFTFNGVAYTCTQIASGSTTYDCTLS